LKAGFDLRTRARRFPRPAFGGFMSVQEFEIEVSGHRAIVYKETSFAPDDPYKFYLPSPRGGGQGCGTIWFRSLAAAKQALMKEKNCAKTGHDLADCNKCGCHKPQAGFKPCICLDAKHEYAVSFETKKRRAFL
jgi:hypothetical protein